MKHDKPLWMKVRDWLGCDADRATIIAGIIIARNRLYWTAPDEDLEQQARKLFNEGK